MATPIWPAAASPARPPQPLPLPAPPPHHDTTLTLALALPLPPPPFVCAITPRPAPRPPDGVAARGARSSLTEDTAPPPPCTECGKQFLSRKALFGHMRCHPERQWRGMTPLPPFRHQAVVAAAAADLQFTDQERETATSLIMLADARPAAGAGKRKKSNLAASPSAKVSCGASTSASLPPTAPAPPPGCGDHKCSVCARGFATGQALGGHKRCHWEKTTCGEGTTTTVATSIGGCSASPTSSSLQAAPATMLDLNLPPPGMPPLPRKWKKTTCGEGTTTTVATSIGGCSASPTSSSLQAAPATMLDLNLPPPGMPPLPRKWKSDQGGSLDATLDLKLGF